MVIYIGVMTLSAVSGMGLLINAVYSARQPHFAFDAATYTPRQTQLCPGETLQIDLVFKVEQAPLYVEFSDSWYRTTDDINIVYGEPKTSIRTETGDFPRVWEVTVPDLPPGEYEYRLGARESLSPVLAFSAPFTVPEGC